MASTVFFGRWRPKRIPVLSFFGSFVDIALRGGKERSFELSDVEQLPFPSPFSSNFDLALIGNPTICG